MSLILCFLAQAGGLSGGGPVAIDGPCITEREHALVAAQAAAFEVPSGPPVEGGPPPLAIFPMGGSHGRDLATSNFVDLQPGAGLLDWNCGATTYNGHDASDVLIRSFGEQLIGVPIFAAIDGTVIATDDGHPDMNTTCTGPANFVVLQHAGGRRTYSWHMKTNSVAVVPGQVVRAGEQLGLTGSSGCSTAPHLHLAVYDANGATLVEPYTGACHPGASQWVEQPAIPPLTVMDFGLTAASIGPPYWPSALPAEGQIALSAAGIRIWAFVDSLPASSTWRVRFLNPSGGVAFNSGTVAYNNPSFYPWSWWYWNYDIAAMHTTPGTWRVQLFLNGVMQVDAPIQVVAVVDPLFNRAPEPIALSFDPPVPTQDEALFCRVAGSLTLDDLDFDIVRYRYVWTVDGAVVRDVVSAGLADAIPHHTAFGGDLVRCTVTPSDGIVDGAAVSIAAVVEPVPPAGIAYCFGDGSGTPCPCGNPGLAGHGCANSVNTSGARLAASGSASIAIDTLLLTGSGMPDSPCLYFQGTSQQGGGAGAVFGDGLRCAGGTIVRLGQETNVAGTSTYPSSGDPTISVRGANAVGNVRTYQAWYRNAAAFCTPSTFNLTNGVQVTWGW